jgi:signal transduction histidine kinase
MYFCYAGLLPFLTGKEMQRLSPRTFAYLVIDVALLAASLFQLPFLFDRPRVPFVLTGRGTAIVVNQIVDATAAGVLAVGDTVLAINNRPLVGIADAEFLSDFLAMDDGISVTVLRNGAAADLQARVIAFFSLRYAIIVLFVGLVTWGVGVFVLLARPGELAAGVLHSALICMGAAVMLMWGSTPASSVWPYLSRSLYFIVYMGVAWYFYFFTTLFPQPWRGSVWRRGVLMAIPPVAVTVVTLTMHLYALSTGRVEDYHSFRHLFDAFHLTIIVYVGLGIGNFLRAYGTTKSSVERKKLQWILWAFSIGPVPFLVLVVIPEFFISVSPVPEEFTLIFLVIIPVAFAISFIKYQLLNIQVVINRTTVYTIAVGTMLLAYTTLIGALTYIVGAYTVESSALAAMVIALGFDPVRKRVQRFVDRKFFRVQYDFRQTERRFVESMKKTVSVQHLGETLVRDIDELIPLERMGMFVLRAGGERVQVVAHKNFDVLEGRGVRFDKSQLRARLDIPVGLSDRIEPGVDHQPGDPAVFKRWGLDVIFPMLSQDGSFLGFLGLGQKKSRARFTSEDIDLLSNVSTQAGLELERIILQHQVLREQAEAQRQKDLNEMKTEFVRIVTHELKTPLTGIKLSAQLLRDRMKKTTARAAWCLDTIEGEVDRLDRMVTTILTSAKVERQVMQYDPQPEDLGEIVLSVMRSMDYQLKKDGFAVVVSGLSGKRRYPVYADRDAVTEAVINLIANSIKYSADRKFLKVSLSRQGEEVRCAVHDRGIGISAEALSHIFEKYYRDPAGERKASGVGLGLPLVKHILEAHHGRVTVESRDGRGSTFTLIFPVHHHAAKETQKTPDR